MAAFRKKAFDIRLTTRFQIPCVVLRGRLGPKVTGITLNCLVHRTSNDKPDTVAKARIGAMAGTTNNKTITKPRVKPISQMLFFFITSLLLSNGFASKKPFLIILVLI